MVHPCHDLWTSATISAIYPLHFHWTLLWRERFGKRAWWGVCRV